MQVRYRALILALAAAVLAFGLAAPGFAAETGKWSIGGNFGIGTYSNGAFNDSLQTFDPPLEKVKDGWEYGGSLRTRLSPKASLEVEGNLLNGKSTTDILNQSVDAKTTAFALPLNLVYLLSENDKYAFNLVVGAGPLLSTKFKIEGAGATFESDSKTAFVGQGGFEGDWFVGKQVAVTARVLGRYAKASDVEYANDPTDPSAGKSKIDLNLSGFAFGLGLRAYFGGTK